MDEQLVINIPTHFQKAGRFYVDHRFNKHLRGQDVLTFSQKRFFRFMDFFYLPKQVALLTSSEIIELCELRNAYYPFVVDTRLNGEIAANIVDYLRSVLGTNTGRNVKVLDFGCGAGASSRMIIQSLPDINLHGIDRSAKAIAAAKMGGLKAKWLRPNKPMQFSNQFFDVVIAIFVMHFPVDYQSLQEIYRVLKWGRPFIFNCYKNEPPSMRCFLHNVGFRRIERLSYFHLPRGHYIYACYKT